MKDFLRTHTCTCDGRRTGEPSCKENSTAAAGGPRQSGGQSSSGHHKTTNGDIMRDALKGALADYAAESAKVSAAVAAQSRANQALVKEQNALKSEALLEDEAKKRAAIQKDLELKKQSALDLAAQLTVLPSSGGLTIGDALQADALKKQALAQRKETCRNAAEMIAKIESGLPRLEVDLAKNRRLISDAEKEIAAAAADAGKETAGFFYNKKYDELEDRLKGFMKTKKQLQVMKKEIDGLEKVAGLKKRGAKLTPEQIVAARKWIDDGIKYSDDLVDSVKMSYKYNTDGGPKNKEQAEGFQQKALGALDDFNTRFMNDAGGWEFVGEHLSETLGPSGKLMFKQAVLGIKLSVDAGSVVIDANSIKGYKKNQEILDLEKSKRLQRIIDFKKVIADNHCDELH